MGNAVAVYPDRTPRPARPIYNSRAPAREVSGHCNWVSGARRGTRSRSARGLARPCDELDAVRGRDASARSHALRLLTARLFLHPAVRTHVCVQLAIERL